MQANGPGRQFPNKPLPDLPVTDLPVITPLPTDHSIPLPNAVPPPPAQAVPPQQVQSNAQQLNQAAVGSKAAVLGSIAKGAGKVAKGGAWVAGQGLRGVGVVGAFLGATALGGIGQAISLPLQALGDTAFQKPAKGEGVQEVIANAMEKAGGWGGLGGQYLFSRASAALLSYATESDYKELLQEQENFNESPGAAGAFFGRVAGTNGGFAALVVSAPIVLPLSVIAMYAVDGFEGTQSVWEKHIKSRDEKASASKSKEEITIETEEDAEARVKQEEWNIEYAEIEKPIIDIVNDKLPQIKQFIVDNKKLTAEKMHEGIYEIIDRELAEQGKGDLPLQKKIEVMNGALLVHLNETNQQTKALKEFMTYQLALQAFDLDSDTQDLEQAVQIKLMQLRRAAGREHPKDADFAIAKEILSVLINNETDQTTSAYYNLLLEKLVGPPLTSVLNPKILQEIVYKNKDLSSIHVDIVNKVATSGIRLDLPTRINFGEHILKTIGQIYPRSDQEKVSEADAILIEKLDTLKTFIEMQIEMEKSFSHGEKKGEITEYAQGLFEKLEKATSFNQNRIPLSHYLTFVIEREVTQDKDSERVKYFKHLLDLMRTT